MNKIIKQIFTSICVFSIISCSVPNNLNYQTSSFSLKSTLQPQSSQGDKFNTIWGRITSRSNNQNNFDITNIISQEDLIENGYKYQLSFSVNGASIEIKFRYKKDNWNIVTLDQESSEYGERSSGDVLLRIPLSQTDVNTYEYHYNSAGFDSHPLFTQKFDYESINKPFFYKSNNDPSFKWISAHGYNSSNRIQKLKTNIGYG